MEQSAKERSTKYNDPVKSKNWTSSASDEDAFIDEYKVMENDGGYNSDTNYNEKQSPGKNIRKKEISRNRRIYMAIIEASGFKFLDGLSSEYIVVESCRINEYVKYIKKNVIKSIYLSSLYYFDSDINFLKECKFVDKVNITSSSIINYSGLSYLKDLEVLLLDEPKGKVDLSLNEFIEELSTGMNKNVVGIDKLNNLKILRLWKYKPKTKDLIELSGLKSIEELKITQSPLVSLNGCGELIKLERLELNYLSKLEYIDEIEKNRKSLKSIRFTSCKKIRNHDYVINLRELELLAFDDCGEIPSIRFIKQITKLKSFIFVNTTIGDGDLSSCEGLEYVGFINKRHYSHKSDDFKK